MLEDTKIPLTIFLCLLAIGYFGSKPVQNYAKALVLWLLADLIPYVMRYVHSLTQINEQQLNMTKCVT
jgi:hypothetical protein